jgi:hypothetical protein
VDQALELQQNDLVSRATGRLQIPPGLDRDISGNAPDRVLDPYWRLTRAVLGAGNPSTEVLADLNTVIEWGEGEPASTNARGRNFLRHVRDILTPAPAATPQRATLQPGEMDRLTDGIEGVEVPHTRVPNGSSAFQYVLGSPDGGTTAVYRRRADERGTYGGWRWESDANRLQDQTPLQQARAEWMSRRNANDIQANEFERRSTEDLQSLSETTRQPYSAEYARQVIAARASPAADEGARVRQALLQHYRDVGMAHPEDRVIEFENYDDEDISLIASNQGVDRAVADFARYVQRSRTMSLPPTAPVATPAPTAVDRARTAVIAAGLNNAAVAGIEAETEGALASGSNDIRSMPEMRAFRFALLESRATHIYMTRAEFEARERQQTTSAKTFMATRLRN